MDQFAQQSFVPKKAFTPVVPPRKKRVSIITILTGVIFFGSLVFYAGQFGYKLFLEKQAEQLKQSISNAGDQFQAKTLAKLTLTDGKLVALNDILSKHRTLLPLFTLLDDYTLQTVRFRTFSFAGTEGKSPTISLTGDAAGYDSIALQSDSFSKSQSLKDIVFSDLTLDQTGRVTFSLTASLDPSLIAIQTVSAPAAQVTSQSPTP